MIELLSLLAGLLLLSACSSADDSSGGAAGSAGDTASSGAVGNGASGGASAGAGGATAGAGGELGGNGGAGAGASPGNDDEAGPADGGFIAGQALPAYLDAPIACDATFATDAQLDDVYDAAQCGDVICASAVFALNADRTLAKECPADSPLWILGYVPPGEGIQARTFTNSDADWTVTGDYHYVAGWRLDGHEKLITLHGSRGSKVVGSFFQGGKNGSGVIEVTGHGGNDGIEIAGTTFTQTAGPGINLGRCDQSLSTCTDFPTDGWIHHNAFLNTPSSGSNDDGIKLGSGFNYEASVPIFNSNGYLYWLVENNLFGGWKIGEEIISIKSSGALIRFNCILDGDGSVVNRSGSSNVIHGNWIGQHKEGLRIAGSGVISAYNFEVARNGGSAMRLHPGVHNEDTGRYDYMPALDGTHRRNVHSNVGFIVETTQRSSTAGAVFEISPSGNVIADLLIRSDAIVADTIQSNYRNPDGNWSAAEFCANNICGALTVVPTDLTESTCFDAGHFEGPMGGGDIIVPDDEKYHQLVRGKVLPPPSWWRTDD
jgi:hypothetical protein